MSFLRRVLAFFGFHPKVTWESGVVVANPRYATLYAEVVRRVRAARPDQPITAPEMVVTVRVYPHGLPAPNQNSYGKVLAPNTIAGDTGGTVCLREYFKDADWLLQHEFSHAITGIPDHPAWLFKRDGTLNL